MRPFLAVLLVAACAARQAPERVTPDAWDGHARIIANTSDRQVLEVRLDRPIADVWALFTTAEGIQQSYGVPRAAIDLRIGGTIRTSYTPDATLEPGDDATIVTTILAFEPERMLATQLTKAPASAMSHVLTKTWSVITLTAITPTQTHLRMVSLGYDGSETADAMRAFFADANPKVMDALREALAEE